MNPNHEKKIRQAIAKAVGKEAAKSVAQVAEFPDPADKKQLERLVQMEIEKHLTPTAAASPAQDATVISYVFRAPPVEGPVHFKVSGMEKAFRESLGGKDISTSIRDSLSVSIEFVHIF